MIEDEDAVAEHGPTIADKGDLALRRIAGRRPLEGERQPGHLQLGQGLQHERAGVGQSEQRTKSIKRNHSGLLVWEGLLAARLTASCQQQRALFKPQKATRRASGNRWKGILPQRRRGRGRRTAATTTRYPQLCRPESCEAAIRDLRSGAVALERAIPFLTRRARRSRRTRRRFAPIISSDLSRLAGAQSAPFVLFATEDCTYSVLDVFWTPPLARRSRMASMPSRRDGLPRIRGSLMELSVLCVSAVKSIARNAIDLAEHPLEPRQHVGRASRRGRGSLRRWRPGVRRCPCR